ncbi:endo alpha-1,4 polygalactosaminidase [Streptomyces sp. NPDC050610]|uniref:endo alpha-1,4 polygalactosaminidase n=1 Tax=Streptomyces sp. NPDC050610 TaxID=3157097 RepID=UPI00343118F1
MSIRSTGTLALSLALITGCSIGASKPAPDEPSKAAEKSVSTESSGDGIRLPQANASFDYQIGGPYTPPDGVRAVSRDRTAKPAAGLYNVCYVNAYQTQPGDAIDWWKDNHDDLLLRDSDGELVVDGPWEEPLLDISTPEKRQDLLDIVGPWIDGCADSGFDAVEPDNLDSYERSDDLLSVEDAAAFAKLLAHRAHDKGLAIAQKNTTDLLDKRGEIGFDFAVAEECAHYKECPSFLSAYNGRVFAIEYKQKDFTEACKAWGKKLSVNLRDRDVSPAGKKGYVSKRC